MVAAWRQYKLYSWHDEGSFRGPSYYRRPHAQPKRWSSNGVSDGKSVSKNSQKIIIIYNGVSDAKSASKTTIEKIIYNAVSDGKSVSKQNQPKKNHLQQYLGW